MPLKKSSSAPQLSISQIIVNIQHSEANSTSASSEEQAPCIHYNARVGSSQAPRVEMAEEKPVTEQPRNIPTISEEIARQTMSALDSGSESSAANNRTAWDTAKNVACGAAVVGGLATPEILGGVAGNSMACCGYGPGTVASIAIGSSIGAGFLAGVGTCLGVAALGARKFVFGG